MTTQVPSPPGAQPPDRSQSAVGSINFVITAIYTVTFGNAIYQVAKVDSAKVTIAIRDDVPATALVCAAICMILALRFFFGNNNFMDAVFSSGEGPWQRLYHFAVTTAQSLLLLGSSYLVTNPDQFIRWLAALFTLEVAWYVGCLALSRGSVSDEHGRLRGDLWRNELANAAVVVTSVTALLVLRDHERALVGLVFAAFMLNTAVDARHNLRGYMGL